MNSKKIGEMLAYLFLGGMGLLFLLGVVWVADKMLDSMRGVC